VKLPLDFVITIPVYPLNILKSLLPEPATVGTTITLKLVLFCILVTVIVVLDPDAMLPVVPEATILPVREVVSYNFVVPSDLKISIP